MQSPTKQATRQGSSKNAIPVPDWSKLSRHDSIKVLQPGGSEVSGKIDMISIDRSVFWMIQDAGLGRVMILSADSPTVIKIVTSAKERSP